ncbi:hypothetical protein [Mycolicibacterium gilvum]|uniref:hypothetical protein n=1 Tax=Mycolicibacterium gilvum TaxID=1804 RepID=UPI004045BB8B
MTEHHDNQTAETTDAGSQLNADGSAALPEGDGTGEAGHGPQRQNREARYRVERNEARQERDQLAERLTQLQTAELHRLAGEYLSAPEDIGLSGKELSEYLTPEGWVDRKAVEEAAHAVIESRPGLSRHAPATDPSQGTGSPRQKPRPQASWANIITV